jgi:hypothetical protein
MSLKFTTGSRLAAFNMMSSPGNGLAVTDSNHAIGLLRSGNPQQADNL